MVATRKKVTLDGTWYFSIPDGSLEPRKVPGSYPCVGESSYTRSFTWSPSHGKRLFLCFEGIAYEGILYLNGKKMGEMLPYSEYRFEITQQVLPGENQIRLDIHDLDAVFGPAEGWKSYSGIIRSVYLEQTEASLLEDIFFFNGPCVDDTADCIVRVQLNGPIEGTMVSAVLSQNGEAASSSECDSSADVFDIHLSVPHPRLWSPESPTLYTLQLSLNQNDVCLDMQTLTVGIKQFEARGNQFYLNGKRIFIAGVCRHDLWTDEAGFTMTDDDIETDLQMIKQTGANFVRLVHYPHDKRVLEAADRIGLLVSEEPGLWWSDLSDKAITGRALEVLRRIMLRDRSHVSVAFWLSFNECVFTPEFLADAARLARQMDPTRLISGANAMSVALTKELFDANGFDFYTFHPYGCDPQHVSGGYGSDRETSLHTIFETLCDKPLVFTEWGGYYVHDNPNLFRSFCREMFSAFHAEKPLLAGMCYWAWQDIYEAQRGEPACVDGILEEGLVSIDRKPKMNYFTFTQMLTEFRCPPREPSYSLAAFGAGQPSARYTPFPLTGRDTIQQKQAWEAAIAASLPMQKMFFKKMRQLPHGPALSHPIARLGSLITDIPAGRPIVASTQTGPLCFHIEQPARALWFIGQCTLGYGWPISGTRTETVGRYLLVYTDGETVEVPLRNGLETATVLGLEGPTAIEPRAAYTSRAFSFHYDKNWEVFHAGLLRVPVSAKKTLCQVTVEITNASYALLLYGITIEDM